MEDLIQHSVPSTPETTGPQWPENRIPFNTTIEKENSITKSSLVSLELFDLEEENLVELPTLFSVKSLPVSAEDVPKQDDVDRWPHLHWIQVSELDVPVGLLMEH